MKVRWHNTRVEVEWYIKPKTEINRLYAIINKSSPGEWNRIPKRVRGAMILRFKQLEKTHRWGGPRKPYWIKKR